LSGLPENASEADATVRQALLAIKAPAMTDTIANARRFRDLGMPGTSQSVVTCSEGTVRRTSLTQGVLSATMEGL
jgi:hypothetical protein